MTSFPDIYILSGPVQTGKTTSLLQWASGRNDVHGILTPVGENGKRYFLDLASKATWPMEAVDGETETLSIGRFVFSATGFQRAVEVIRDSINKPGWLVIDEIGPMELRGEGFSEILRQCLIERKNNLLLIIRKGLEGTVCECFGIGGICVFKF